MPYDPKAIESKWQKHWLEHQTFRAEIDPARPKFYVLDMFPYPSGEGLHVGHPKGYISTDVLARYKRMRGFQVLHPMGWDAFGLPAEQHAIETGTHPRVTTKRNIDTYRRQLRALGLSYDWSREIDTTDPRYVRWTQWIFARLHERGLAYQAEVPVNWCPALGTVLANEEVIDGRSERGGHPVVRVPLRQWMLRITAYADRLLEDLDGLDWPEPIKKMQRDWIGRSEGARIRFALPDHPGESIEVFTTRPDTLFGATYLVLAPEHPLVAKLSAPGRSAALERYVEEAARKSERSRLAEAGEKTGVPTGAFASHPVTGAKLPVWVADYVLAGYGTGAIMAVPAHDERDFAFARSHGLPVVEVVSGGDVSREAFTGEGTNVNSQLLDGLPTPRAKQRMIEWLEEHGCGERTVSYKLRDWLFSRQRYWGEPFPVLHLADGTTKLVPDSELPVLLPELDDYHPSGEFEGPLARARSWIETTDPETGEPARRDPNTMPNWAGSCWYYLRFCDPGNDREAWSREAERYWMPVDLYVGGAEHAVLHLLYARFWHKVLFDLGRVHTKEPFQKLLNQGLVLGTSYRYWDDNATDDPARVPRCYPTSAVRVEAERTVAAATGAPVKARWVPRKDVRFDADGTPLHPTLPDLPLEEVVERMSKSRGNVINPDEVIAQWGADAMRLYELFMGPFEKGAPWSTDGISGVHRFLQRAWRLVVDDEDGERLRELAGGSGSEAQQRLLARTIQGVTEDVEALQFNTAISKLMVFAREIAKDAPLAGAAADAFVLLLAPFAPHVAEELWERLGHRESLARAPWPEADARLLESALVDLVVQVNGKRRDEIRVPAGAGDDEIRAAALAAENVKKHLAGREPKKVVIVPGRLVNVVG
jgi:leucyl-tRNA synthetase